jgi:hypothetical protein
MKSVTAELAADPSQEAARGAIGRCIIEAELFSAAMRNLVIESITPRPGLANG